MAEVETWSVERVADAYGKDEVVLIDVRTPQEYMLEHVPGALLLPMSFFDPAKLPSQDGKRIVFYCGSSARSGKVAKQAAEAGLDPVTHMDGGFAAWKKSGQTYTGTDMSTGAPKEMRQDG